MAIKIIKVLKGTENYLVKDGVVKDRYEPGCGVIATLDNGSVISVEPEQVSLIYGGQVMFKYDDNRYLIDDGFQNLLIRSGYIVLNDHDKCKIEDKEEGVNIRNSLFTNSIENIDNVVSNLKYEYIKRITKPYHSATYEFAKDGYSYTVCLDTVNNIVYKNQQRKTNDLPFYPFIKDMDKYGTLFLTIFCEKIEDSPVPKDKYDNAEEFLTELMKSFNSDVDHYKFERIDCRKRINYCEGI